ncbi:MAG: sulfotransferase [Gallionella sp.]|nr:sulfotransferase [Gallionella sp.]
MNINDALQKAVHCHQAGQLQAAEELYRSILQIQPNQPDANHNLGLIAIHVGMPASGLPYLQNAWKINPHKEQFCLTLTECLLTMERPGDALQIIKNAVEQKSFNSAQARHLLQLATSIVEGERPALSVELKLSTLFSAGHHAALEEKLTPLLDQHPSWGAGWDMLCTTLQIQGKDSGSALERAVQFKPDNTDAHSSQQKVFCIGANKTGTTSVEHVLRSLGLTVGNQEQAEMLVFDWAERDYRRIIKYCQSAQAFQDVPFSLHGTFQVMDDAFPGSKFILTVRNNVDQWFGSLVRFHTAIVGKGRIPTADDLRQFNYRYPGFMLDVLRLSYGADKSTLYNRDVYSQYYEDHNNQVKEYFKERPDDLLILNVEEPDAMERLVKFLGYPYTGQKMPHLNTSKD